MFSQSTQALHDRDVGCGIEVKGLRGGHLGSRATHAAAEADSEWLLLAWIEREERAGHQGISETP